MNTVKDNELNTINGGGIRWGILAGIGALATFIIGVFDGYTNPTKCRN